MISRKGLEELKSKVERKTSASSLTGAVKRSMQPTLQDYKISAQILQGAIKRKQVQPLYQSLAKSSRSNLTMDDLIELSKPYLLKTLRDAWKNEMYSSTLYKKPLNKLKKAELYHELINANYNISKLPQKQLKRR